MDDCIFCKIVRGEIPCKKVYEDEKFLAFLDISPISEGHSLLIPKDHYRWVYDVPDIGAYFEIAKKIAFLIKSSSLNPEYISLLTMGNEVPHAHIHIIPRSKGDSIGPVLQTLPHLKLSDEKFNDILNQIKS